MGGAGRAAHHQGWRLSSRTDIQPRSLQEASHYRIAVVRNSASAQQLIRQGLAPVSVNSEEDKFRMLLRGRVELVTALDLGPPFTCTSWGTASRH